MRRECPRAAAGAVILARSGTLALCRVGCTRRIEVARLDAQDRRLAAIALAGPHELAELRNLLALAIARLDEPIGAHHAANEPL